MRGVFVVLLCSLAFGLIVSGPNAASSAPRLTADGLVSAAGGAVVSEFGPNNGSTSISDSMDGAIDTPTIDIASYSAMSSASAGYGVLRAAASVEFSGATTRFGSIITSAEANARFVDDISFDSAGLTGQAGFAAMTITLSGSSSAFADGNLWSTGGGGVVATVGGVTESIRQGIDTFGNMPVIDPPTKIVLFEIVFGELMELDVRLNSTVRSRANSGILINGSGSASGLFGNTAGVNGFEVFDQAMNPVDFLFTTASGEFEFYPVPEPSTGLLMGLGLSCLAMGQRRRN